MDDEKKTNDGLKETFSDKVNKIMRDWIIDIVVAVMLIVYVLKTVVTIEMTNADVFAILGDCALLLVFMMTIKALMLRKGIFAGEKQKGYITVKEKYDNQLSTIMPKSQYLADFVSRFNERNKRVAVSMHLSTYGVSYDDYVSGADNADEYQRKGIALAGKVKYLTISIEDLTGSGLNKSKKNMSLGQSKNDFMSNKSVTDISLTVLSVVIFAVFTFKLTNDLNWASFIWVLMQLVVFLMKGALSFLSGLMFITEDYTNRTIRQTNLLIEFDNIPITEFEAERQEKIEAIAAEKVAKLEAIAKVREQAEDIIIDTPIEECDNINIEEDIINE